jgi:hypothetical protein
MSAAPHLKRKDLKLCSHTRRPGQKPGLFAFAETGANLGSALASQGIAGLLCAATEPIVAGM